MAEDGEEKRITIFEESEEARSAARAAVKGLQAGLAEAQLPAARQLWDALEPLDWVRALRRRLHGDRAVRLDAVCTEAGCFDFIANSGRQNA